MTRTYRCNECYKDCGIRAKVVIGDHYHFCSYRCAKLHFEKSEILYEETDSAVKEAYWAARRRNPRETYETDAEARRA